MNNPSRPPYRFTAYLAILCGVLAIAGLVTKYYANEIVMMFEIVLAVYSPFVVFFAFKTTQYDVHSWRYIFFRTYYYLLLGLILILVVSTMSGPQ